MTQARLDEILEKYNKSTKSSTNTKPLKIDKEGSKKKSKLGAKGITAITLSVLLAGALAVKPSRDFIVNGITRIFAGTSAEENEPTLDYSYLNFTPHLLDENGDFNAGWSDEKFAELKAFRDSVLHDLEVNMPIIDANFKAVLTEEDIENNQDFRFTELQHIIFALGARNATPEQIAYFFGAHDMGDLKFDLSYELNDMAKKLMIYTAKGEKMSGLENYISPTDENYIEMWEGFTGDAARFVSDPNEENLVNGRQRYMEYYAMGDEFISGSAAAQVMDNNKMLAFLVSKGVYVGFNITSGAQLDDDTLLTSDDFEFGINNRVSGFCEDIQGTFNEAKYRQRQNRSDYAEYYRQALIENKDIDKICDLLKNYNEELRPDYHKVRVNLGWAYINKGLSVPGMSGYYNAYYGVYITSMEYVISEKTFGSYEEALAYANSLPDGLREQALNDIANIKAQEIDETAFAQAYAAWYNGALDQVWAIIVEGKPGSLDAIKNSFSMKDSPSFESNWQMLISQVTAQANKDIPAPEHKPPLDPPAVTPSDPYVPVEDDNQKGDDSNSGGGYWDEDYQTDQQETQTNQDTNTASSVAQSQVEEAQVVQSQPAAAESNSEADYWDQGYQAPAEETQTLGGGGSSVDVNLMRATLPRNIEQTISAANYAETAFPGSPAAESMREQADEEIKEFEDSQRKPTRSEKQRDSKRQLEEYKKTLEENQWKKKEAKEQSQTNRFAEMRAVLDGMKKDIENARVSNLENLADKSVKM